MPKPLNWPIKRGIITVLDAGPAQDYPLEKLPPVTILSPNETETKALVGIYPADHASCREAAQKSDGPQWLQIRGPETGRTGLLPLRRRFGCDGSPYKVDAIDPTAAGDAFTGTLAKAFVEMGDLVEAAKYASASGP